MEHGVYLCSWSRSSEGYALWVKSRPEVRADGSNYEEAEARLIAAIQDADGVTHAVLEFDPPLPLSAMESKFTDPELYLIGGDDRFEADVSRRQSFETAEQTDDRLQEIDAYYRSPVCRNCRWPSSDRSEKPLTLTSAPSRDDGAFGEVGNEGGPTIQLVTEEFLRLLTSEEAQALQLRPVKRRGRGRIFHELVGPAGPPFVAVAGLRAGGWKCARCDHRTWGYWIDGLNINAFVARSDLPSDLSRRGIFTVGGPPEVHLAVTASRWKELTDRSGTRGFASRRLGVVADRDVIRCPHLDSFERT